MRGLTPGSFTTINPTTEAVLAQYEAHSEADLDSILSVANEAQAAWARIGIKERAEHVWRLADVLEARAPGLARIATLEMGKPITEAVAEVHKCVAACRHFAENAVQYLADEPVATDDADCWISYEPIGVVLAIMPWNYPYWQVIRNVAPGLLVGNAIVLKHASATTGCALALADAFKEAGIPAGLFSVALVASTRVSEVTDRLIADDRIAAVTVTGSDNVGALVAQASGRAIKKSVLELGGNDAFIVLDDADVERAAAVGVQARFGNAGQSCIAAKRFIVAEPVYGRFVAALLEQMSTLRLGDPLDPRTDIGPLARGDLREELLRQIAQSGNCGAHIHTVGQIPPVGYYVAPAVLTDVSPEMPVCTEETFGPVAVVLAAHDDGQAAAIARQSRWGLGLSVWSRQRDRATALARSVSSGAVAINCMVKSDVRLPFGGTRKSGYGRELAKAGMLEFTNIRAWRAE
jgi:succinate-semialdehyde dehydrogenase/glutarate-semialdehyde dehydrogenase